MTDKIDPVRRSRNMRAIKGKNTKPEHAIRRLLHRLGYRFTVHRRDLPGCPDIVFSARKRVVQVHGCFWHQHPNAGCRDARLPRSNTGYWLAKLRRNVERDALSEHALSVAGWSTLTIWECEISDEAALTERLREFIGPVRHSAATTDASA